MKTLVPREGEIGQDPVTARAPSSLESVFFGGGTRLVVDVRARRDGSPGQGFRVREKTSAVNRGSKVGPDVGAKIAAGLNTGNVSNGRMFRGSTRSKTASGYAERRK